jgi:hypothetical protein
MLCIIPIVLLLLDGAGCRLLRRRRSEHRFADRDSLLALRNEAGASNETGVPHELRDFAHTHCRGCGRILRTLHC